MDHSREDDTRVHQMPSSTIVEVSTIQWFGPNWGSLGYDSPQPATEPIDSATAMAGIDKPPATHS
jgi:hypothetical protein